MATEATSTRIRPSWKRGSLTAFVERHALAWELTTAMLTVAYVVLAFGVGAAASERLIGGSALWVLGPILLTVWIAASYGYYELEGGLNPRIQTFGDALYFSFVSASTVGYGDVTPVTGAGKVLTGLLIFVGIGLLGFASAQLTTRLMPQKNELAELRATMDRQHEVLLQVATRVDAMATRLEDGTEAQIQSS